MEVKYTETRKTKTQNDKNLVLPKEQVENAALYKPVLNKITTKREYWKGLLLFVEEGATVDGDYYLKIKLEIILWTKVHYSTKWARCHTLNSFTSYLSENAPHYISKEN